MFSDYIFLSETYDKVVDAFLWNLNKAVVFIGENNVGLYNKFFLTNKKIFDKNQLSWGQKRKLGIAVLHNRLNKKYSRRKIKFCLYLHKADKENDKREIRIIPSSVVFKKLLDEILLLLKDEQIAELKNNNFSTLPYERRINQNILFLAPVQCDMIISAGGRFKNRFERNGESLVRQIRKGE